MLSNFQICQNSASNLWIFLFKVDHDSIVATMHGKFLRSLLAIFEYRQELQQQRDKSV